MTNSGLILLGLAICCGAVVANDARAQEQAGGGGAATTTAPRMPTFESYLDSLRARSEESIDRKGVKETWPVADSLETLTIEEGPTVADTARAWRSPYRLRFDVGPALLDYNRVEGFRLGAEIELRYGPASIEGAGAYAFSSKEWRYRGRARYDAGRYGDFTFTYADIVPAYGLHPVPGNWFYAFIAGADDQDYLHRSGGSLDWHWDRDNLYFDAWFHVVDERSVPAITDWNLFQRDRGPRPNPPITEGRAHRLHLGAGDDVEIHRLRDALWRWRAWAEIGGYGLGGDFDYDRYFASLRADMHALGRDDIRLDLRVGTARNGPPRQSLFYLGGPLFLRAYPVHAFGGDRMMAASFDYFIGYDFFGMIGLKRVELQFVPFGEIGAAWTDPNGTGFFSKPASSDWKSDAGLGIQRNIFFGISARFDLAYRLDRSNDRFTWRFRFETPLFDRLED